MFEVSQYPFKRCLATIEEKLNAMLNTEKSVVDTVQLMWDFLGAVLCFDTEIK